MYFIDQLNLSSLLEVYDLNKSKPSQTSQKSFSGFTFRSHLGEDVTNYSLFFYLILS